jgi:hypothetical protein
MSYSSGINQRILNQTLFNNYSAQDEPITQTNLSLISNLKYVQNWGLSILNNYLTILNPIFTGILSGSTININNSLSVPNITNNTNFLINPTINNTQMEENIIGEIKISFNKTPPPNYILCDGSTVSISQYQKLYNLIGNIYGASTATSFTLPNFNSYFPIGANGNITSLSKTVPASNYNGGNLSTFSNFAGSSSPIPPIIKNIYQHDHNITDPTHAHIMPFANSFDVQMEIGQPPYAGPFPTLYTSSQFPNPYQTDEAITNIIINNTGDNIENIDLISSLNGVNVCPPFVAVYYFINYN